METADVELEDCGEEPGLAEYCLACDYRRGKDVERNLVTAFRLYKSAAEKGYFDAVNNVAACYLSGTGVERDLDESERWYNRAIANGDKKNVESERAHLNIALVHYLKKEYEDAVRWWTKAANRKGSRHRRYAMYHLGRCYEIGKGVNVDLKKAKLWYSRAATRNDPDSIRALADVESLRRSEKREKRLREEVEELREEVAAYRSASKEAVEVLKKPQRAKMPIAAYESASKEAVEVLNKTQRAKMPRLGTQTGKYEFKKVADEKVKEGPWAGKLTKEHIDKMKVPQLQAALDDRNLNTDGLKADLKERLLGAIDDDI